jgi:hypothetical protein
MEWEEALLMAWSGEMPPHPGGYYRQQAARARRVAEGATRPGRVLGPTADCGRVRHPLDLYGEIVVDLKCSGSQDSALVCWPISARVGSVKNNDASLIEPVAA